MTPETHTLDAWDPATDAGPDPALIAVEVADAERRERERLAEALHDDALQRLLAARQDLVQAGSDPESVRSVERQLVELTESLRALTRAMHEDALAALPLTEALERLCEDAARRGRFAVRTQVDPAASGDHDLFVQSVVRELLANVVKHAGATTVQVSVQARPDVVTVRVSDDGRGTTLHEVEAAGRAGHVGHAQLGRRLRAIGGTVEIDSSPIGGTTVTCQLPLEQLRVQRVMEEDLRRERRWSAALVAAMQDGFLVFRDGSPTQVNDRFCAMTGFARDALIGPGPPPFWQPDGPTPLGTLLAEATADAGTEHRVSILRADGSSFPALISARTILEDQGGRRSTLVTVKDITALELEAERARQAQELDAIVASTNRLRGLLDKARAVHTADGLNALLDEIVRIIAQDLGWVAVMNLYRPETDDFVMATAHGLDADGWKQLAGTMSTWTEWTPLLDDRFEHGGAYFVPDITHVAGADFAVTYTAPGELEVLDHADAWRPNDMLLIPVRHTDEHFLGILSLGDPDSGMRPRDAELQVLTAIASHAALAVQHAQGAIAAARNAAAVQQLLEVSSKIAATREVEPMLAAIAQAISDALGFQRVLVELVDEQGRVCPRTAIGLRLADLEGPDCELRAHELESVFTRIHPEDGCFVLDRREAGRLVPKARRGLLASRSNGAGWRAWRDNKVLVPLHGPRDELVGVIWVDDPADRLRPSASQLQVLHTFANQATAALIAADRFERMEVATDGDPVTRLGNRRAFLRELDRELARCIRTGIGSVLVLVSVEGAEGLEEDAPEALWRAASAALGEIAAAFQEDLRRNDRAFRLEGALFAVLLTGGSGSPDTIGVARRVLQRLRDSGSNVRVHFGVSDVGPGPDQPSAILRRAGESLTAGVRTAEAHAAARLTDAA